MILRTLPDRVGAATPWLVLVASLLFTGTATLLAGWSAYERDQVRFLNAVQSAHDRVQARLEVYLATLRGGAALFAASNDVTERDFRRYAERLDLQARYPGIQGIGWSERVAAGLSGAVDERHAIRYLEPLDERNRAALGFDMYSEPTRRAAMSRARDKGEPAVSGKVTLVQEIFGHTQAGFLIYIPVYGGGEIPRSVQQRREALRGFVYSPFRADDLFAGLFGSERQPRVSLRVYDGRQPDPELLLHASPRARGYEPQRTAVRHLNVAGRPWSIVYASTPAFEAGSAGFLVPAVLLTGLLASGLLFWLAWGQARARIAAERANRAKSDFLSAMSHELRTPLNAIAGYVDLLDLGVRGPVSEAQRSDLQRIKRAQEHLLALINDVLHFAKLEAGRLEITTSMVSVPDLVEEIGALVEPQVRAKGLAYRRAPMDAELRACGDPDRIRQILLNLVTNAVKFTPSSGQITIDAKGDHRGVTVRVIDTGRGIPADKLDAVFDPFVQVDRRATEASQQGVGLGLAISRELARAMGGDLTVESTLGKGSTFCLRLPASTDAG